MQRQSAALVLAALALTITANAADDPNNVTGDKGLILIDKRGSHIRFLDPRSFAEQSRHATGPLAPHDLAISPDHRTAYVPIYGDGVFRKNPNPGRSILIIDLPSQTVTGTIDISPHQAPHGIQIDANGTLYVVADISKTLLIIDPKARRVEAAIDVEGMGHWLAILPDATKAYVANQTDVEFISVVDLKMRKMTGKIPSRGGSLGIVAAPDGRRVYAMEAGESDVMVIDTERDEVIDQIRLQGHSQRGYKLRLSPDGRTLVTCTSLSGQPSFVNIISTTDLHGQQAVLRAGVNAMGFGFAADGRTVLVANDGDGTVTVIDTATRTVVRSFKAGTGIESLSFF